MTPERDDDFDETVGGTERPDVRAAAAALSRTRPASIHTDEIIVESQRLIAQVRAVRASNHFTDKFREIIFQGAKP